MSERLQPVHKGVDKRGEIIWGFIPMARWQMAMFPLKYYGDFMAHWIKRQFCDITGYESDLPSMDLRAAKAWKPRRRVHSGD